MWMVDTFISVIFFSEQIAKFHLVLHRSLRYFFCYFCLSPNVKECFILAVFSIKPGADHWPEEKNKQQMSCPWWFHKGHQGRPCSTTSSEVLQRIMSACPSDLIKPLYATGHMMTGPPLPGNPTPLFRILSQWVPCKLQVSTWKSDGFFRQSLHHLLGTQAPERALFLLTPVSSGQPHLDSVTSSCLLPTPSILV